MAQAGVVQVPDKNLPGSILNEGNTSPNGGNQLGVPNKKKNKIVPVNP